MIYVSTVDGILRQYCEKYLNLRKAGYNGTVVFYICNCKADNQYVLVCIYFRPVKRSL